LYYCKVKIFRKIRSAFGEKNLANKAKLLIRQKQVQNFNTAKTIGILFDAGNAEDLRHVKEFGKYLASIHIEFSTLGYLDSEIVSDDLLFLGNINIFCQKDLDFFFRPSHRDALEFMSKRFDILIDLSLKNHYPLRYIANLSPAIFKVGQYTEGNTIHDLMIDIHSKPTIVYLIEQIKNYVSILNNPVVSSNN